MIKNRLSRATIGVVAAALAIGGIATPAFAQRDPAYDAARKSGAVGEKPDGYLAVVGAGSAALQAMVDELNIKRREVYAAKAQAQRATLEEYAITAGCLAIARTEPGEKYMAPDGTWQTRTAAPPIRSPKCP